MRLESQGLGPMDDNLGRAILIRDVYRPRPIFPQKPGIRAHKLTALFFLLPPALPPSPTSFGAEDDGECEGKCRDKFGLARSLPKAILEEVLILVDKGHEDIFGRRMAESRLHCHPGRRVTSIRKGLAREAT